MAMTCTRCEGTGFLNTHQLGGYTSAQFDAEGDHNVVLEWIKEHDDHDVQVCDCCGNGEEWHNVPGEHYNGEERDGAYDYNGGLCECH